MEKIKKNTALLFAGGISYFIMEILWRGFSHWTMALAGGISFVLLTNIFKTMKNTSHLLKALIGGAVITSVELIFGLVFNIGLGMNIWDYSERYANFLGQICPLFSLFWCGISFMISVATDIFSKKTEKYQDKTLPKAAE